MEKADKAGNAAYVRGISQDNIEIQELIEQISQQKSILNSTISECKIGINAQSKHKINDDLKKLIHNYKTVVLILQDCAADTENRQKLSNKKSN